MKTLTLIAKEYAAFTARIEHYQRCIAMGLNYEFWATALENAQIDFEAFKAEHNIVDVEMTADEYMGEVA